MALIHDLPEAVLMDIPMPAGDAHLSEPKKHAELAIIASLLGDLGERYVHLHREFLEGVSPEARLVRGLDKAQMMIRVCLYQQEGRGRLEEFWTNPRNFDDHGMPEVSELFDTICRVAGRPRPGSKSSQKPLSE